MRYTSSVLQSRRLVGSSNTMDKSRDLYPYCIVWSPLPPITWILPFIGHTGICDSQGVIYDFAGPYTIGVGHMAFGSPTKYIKLDPNKCTNTEWDQAIQEGCDIYSKRMHNIFCDNCHSHIAKCLNVMGYGGKSSYSMILIGVWFFFLGSFTSVNGFLRTYAPFGIITLIIVLSVTLS